MPFELFISQVYFMMSTMMTVGYGDISAAKYPQYSSPDNMALLFFLLFMSIFTFSLIRQRLFSLQFDIKLNEYVSKIVQGTQLFLNDIDRILGKINESKRKKLSVGAADLPAFQLHEQLSLDVINTV